MHHPFNSARRSWRKCAIVGLAAAGLILSGAGVQMLNGSAMNAAKAATVLPYQDQSLPFSVRAADLVSRMTLEEKQSQFRSTFFNQAPAIPRLGVRTYNYWSEALHGVAGTGFGGYTTDFPTGLAISSTWDRPLVNQMTTAISDEARDESNDPYRDSQNNPTTAPAGTTTVYNSCYDNPDLSVNCKGLTYWSPTINMDRDPRWGRADETYGEDPYLTGEIAGQFISGMQGENGAITSQPDSISSSTDSSVYLKTVSTPKHFLANNSEVNRHNGTSNITLDALHNYYTAQFGRAMGQDYGYGAKSTMTSYNSLSLKQDYTTPYNTGVSQTAKSGDAGDIGTPSSADAYSNNTILRRIYGFDGFITSDCGAVDNSWEQEPSGHSWHQIWDAVDSSLTSAQQTALAASMATGYALKAGTDVDCFGNTYGTYAIQSQSIGYSTEQDWDVALTRAFTIRMELGEFDTPSNVPWLDVTKYSGNRTTNPTSPYAVDSDSHEQTAHQMALEAPVLLKNTAAAGASAPSLPLTTASGKNTVLLGYYSENPLEGNYSPEGDAHTLQSVASQFDKYIAANGGTLTVYGDDNTADMAGDANLPSSNPNGYTAGVTTDAGPAVNGAVGNKPTISAVQFLDANGEAVGTPMTLNSAAIDNLDITTDGLGYYKGHGFSGSDSLMMGNNLMGWFQLDNVAIPAGAVSVQVVQSGTSLVSNAPGSPCVDKQVCDTVASYGVSANGAAAKDYTIQHQDTMQASSAYADNYLPTTISLQDLGLTAGSTASSIRFTFNGGGSGAMGVALTACSTSDCSAASDKDTAEYKIKHADNVVVYLGTSKVDSTEEQDRLTTDLPRYQAQLADQAAKWNPKTVVWIQSVGLVKLTGTDADGKSFDLSKDAASIVWTDYNGEYQGEAAAELMFNQDVTLENGTKIDKVDPSGHLTWTWYSDADDQLTASTDYALTTADGAKCGRTYWYYTTDGGTCTAPVFEFGDGLSYGHFTYSDLSLSKTTVTPNDETDATVTVTNDGTYAGSDTVQLYVQSPKAGTDDRPYEQLKGFQRTGILQPGVPTKVTIPLKASDMWIWDQSTQADTWDQGDWTVYVGDSSNMTTDLKSTLTMSGDRADGVDIVAAIPDGTQLNMETPNDAIHANLSVTKEDQSFWSLSDSALKVTYSASPAGIVNVTADGTVTPVKEGSALVTATASANGETKSTTFPVVVRDGIPSAAEAGVTAGQTDYGYLVNFPDATIQSGSKVPAASVIGGNGKVMSGVTCSYMIAPMDLNEAGATIAADGTLTATGTGQVRVTVIATIGKDAHNAGVQYSRSDLVTVGSAKAVALADAISAAKAADTSNATAASAAALAAALAEAEALAANPAATDDQLSAEAAKLAAAQTALAPKADTSALNSLVNALKSLDTSADTASSVAALKSALTAAEALLSAGDASQADVDSALSSLVAAVSGLKPVPAATPTQSPTPTPTPLSPAEVANAAAKADLQAVVDGLAGIKTAGYTTASGKALTDALAKAAALLKTANPSTADLQSALAGVKAALEGLASNPPLLGVNQPVLASHRPGVKGTVKHGKTVKVKTYKS
ncbi:MAG: glycoside hydrolase family 3 C-terminal domain-containing protein, partial [Bifidobacteriaceae bacterium]|nr:glycoside hydrolase family 3 C-terminal domain-containing protein [Bifidobacteriaceae bacterium]